MRKLLVASAFALAAMTSGAMAAEPLTTAQLDKVTAAGVQVNVNRTIQIALARASAGNFCAFAKCSNGGAVAAAANSNVTGQANVD
jgi:hypothetical protein